MLLFTTLHPSVSCLSDIVRSLYRRLHHRLHLSSTSPLSSSSPFIVVSLRRSLLTSHASYVVRSSHHFPSANRTSPIPGLIVSPHRRLHFILRPLSPSSSLSLAPLRRRLINLSAFVVLVIVVSESSQAAFVVSGQTSIERYVSIVITFSYRHRFHRRNKSIRIDAFRRP